MKHMLIILTPLLLYGCTSTTVETEKKRSTETWFSKSESGWNVTREIQYVYTTSGKVSETVTRVFRDSTWANLQKDTFFYKEHDLLHEFKREQWKEETWSPLFGSFYTYSGADSDIIIKRIDTTYDASINRPPSIRIEYLYDDNGNLIEQNGTVNNGNQWVNQSRALTVYDTENHVIERYFPRYIDGDWENARRMILSYDEKGNHIRTLRQNWVDENWEPGVNYQLSVDEEGLRTQEMWQRMINGEWTDFNKVVHEYK